MKYALVATTGYLLLVDLEKKTTVPIEGARKEYYGISWFPDCGDLVLSHTGLDNETLVDLKSYALSELGWISAGKRCSRKFLSAPHQIICASDGRVVCTNTGRNVISVIDLDKPGLYQEAGVSEARWDRLSKETLDGDHLNSVFQRGDRLHVIAHRFTKGAKLAEFSYPELELLRVESLGERTGLHNIWITPEGQRISCGSTTGSLIDLDADAALWEAASPVYTRGLAASKDYVLVGESQKSGRDLRRSSLSGLWILDRHTWAELDYICLGPYGCVNEVRLLDVPDEAHHGRTFAGLSRLLEQDMREAVAAERLRTARAGSELRKLWEGYSLIFGSPETLENGMQRANEDNLCLVVKKIEKAESEMSFTYELAPSPGQVHVSAVLNYHGTGGDDNMVALLLQPVTPSAARLSVWRHDGAEWICLENVSTGNLPLAGVCRVTVVKEQVMLSINDNKIHEFDLKTDCMNLGIRWLGAVVKPVMKENNA